MARSVLETIIKVVKQGGGDKETIKGLSDMKKSIGDAMSIMGGLVAAGAAVYSAFKQTAGVFIEYAAQVRDLSRITGMGAEQTSRLIQVADDAKVSYESLTKALWYAAKSGIEPNIEQIARLADQYVALNDPVKQAELLTKNFGKGGAEMGKLLELGSEGVMKLNAGVNQNMVLTEQAVQQARQWEIQIDNLNDSVMGLKVAAGENLIPALSALLNVLSQLASSGSSGNLGESLGVDFANKIKAGEVEIKNLSDLAAQAGAFVADYFTPAIDGAGESSLMLSEAARESADALAESSDAAAIAAEEARNLAEQQKEVLDVAFRLQDALDSYNDTMSDINAREQEAQATWEEAQQLYEERKISTEELQKAEENYNQSMAETGQAAERAAAQHQEAMNRIIFSIIQAQLAADGLTAEESKGLLQVSVQLGLVDQATADMATQIVDSFSDAGDAIRTDGIGPMYKFNEQTWIARVNQGTFTYRFNLITSGSIPNFAALGKGARDAGIDESGAGGSGLGGGAFASGGQLGQGWAVVGEQGYEYISPSGYVFSHSQSKALEAAGIMPENAFGLGGQGIGGLKAAAKQMQTKYHSGSSSTTSNSTTTAAVIAASDNVSAAATQSAQTNAQTQADMQAATEATKTAIESSNGEVVSAVKTLGRNIEQLQGTTERAIREGILMAVSS